MTRISDTEFCLFHNDRGQSVGECALEVKGWLAEHPEYQGAIYGDWDLGGPRDDFDATELFEDLLREIRERLENLDDTLAQIAVEGNEITADLVERAA